MYGNLYVYMYGYLYTYRLLYMYGYIYMAIYIYMTVYVDQPGWRAQMHMTRPHPCDDPTNGKSLGGQARPQGIFHMRTS